MFCLIMRSQSRSEIPLSQQLWGFTLWKVITFPTGDGVFSTVSADLDRFSFEMRHFTAIILSSLGRLCALQTVHCILKAYYFLLQKTSKTVSSKPVLLKVSGLV